MILRAERASGFYLPGSISIANGVDRAPFLESLFRGPFSPLAAFRGILDAFDWAMVVLSP